MTAYGSNVRHGVIDSVTVHKWYVHAPDGGTFRINEHTYGSSRGGLSVLARLKNEYDCYVREMSSNRTPAIINSNLPRSKTSRTSSTSGDKGVPDG